MAADCGRKECSRSTLASPYARHRPSKAWHLSGWIGQELLDPHPSAAGARESAEMPCPSAAFFGSAGLGDVSLQCLTVLHGDTEGGHPPGAAARGTSSGALGAEGHNPTSPGPGALVWG